MNTFGSKLIYLRRVSIESFLAFIIIAVNVTLDIIWFDSYGKRWGW